LSAARYELFLRASAPLPEETLAELEAACQAASPPVALDPYRAEDGALRGVDLRIDPTGPGAAKRLCALAFEVARDRALTVFDPQLARVVGESESAAIEEHAARGGAFAEGAALSPVAGSSSANARLWLIVALVVVAVLLLMRFLR
jgi:hypothetical protein